MRGIVTCGLAVIGAFFVALQVAWLLKLEPEWLPYPAALVGALLAGLAASRTAEATPRDAFVAGAAAIALLAAISFAIPHAFTLTAARSSHAALVVPLLAIASGLACAAGAWLRGDASRVWLAVTSGLVAICAIQLGGRLAYAAGLPVEPAALAAFGIVAAGASGALIAATVRRDCASEVALGVLGVVVWMIVTQLVLHSAAAMTAWDLLFAVGAPFAAAIGARLTRRAE